MEKNKNPKLMNLVLATSIEVFSGSTFNGVPNIIRTKHLPVKIVWAVLIIMSIGASSYFTITGLMEYLEFNTRSKIFSKTEDSNTFPALTFCSTLFFPKWSVSRPIVYTFLENKTGKKINDEKDFMNIRDSLDAQNLLYTYYLDLGITLVTSSFNDSTRKSIGFNKSEFILECTFNSVPCDMKSIIWLYNGYYGNCFRLNLGYDENLNKSELFEQSEAVYYRGLSLKLFAGVFDSLFTDFFNFYENFGIAVSVDNQTDIPLADTRFFLLDTGFTHFFGMRKSVTKNLPSPFSECVDTTTYTSELQNELALQKIKYSKHNCVLLCHQKYVKDICDCYNPASIPLKETRPCLGDRDINCTFRACENFNINVQCNSQTCPDECEKVDYQFSRSSILFPSPSFHYPKWKKDPRVVELFRQANISQDQITYDRLRSSIVGFTFYFESMDVIYIQSEQARLFLDFLSGVGGFWGLFLGASFLSFFEIVECVVEVILARQATFVQPF